VRAILSAYITLLHQLYWRMTTDLLNPFCGTIVETHRGFYGHSQRGCRIILMAPLSPSLNLHPVQSHYSGRTVWSPAIETGLGGNSPVSMQRSMDRNYSRRMTTNNKPNKPVQTDGDKPSN
jgi:hypothetical protein